MRSYTSGALTKLVLSAHSEYSNEITGAMSGGRFAAQKNT